MSVPRAVKIGSVGRRNSQTLSPHPIRRLQIKVQADDAVLLFAGRILHVGGGDDVLPLAS
jgi:hypothetical protein